MLIRMFVTNWVARLGGWLDWVAGSTGWLRRYCLGADSSADRLNAAVFLVMGRL